MASKLGSVWVELNLDDKVYKQKLSEQLTSTQTTAKGIETSWRALGVKSDAYFDMQRRSAENAYTLIKNSALSTSNDIVRAEKAKNDKIKALTDQQLGHQQSMFAQLKTHWMGIAATAAVVMGTVRQLTNAFMEEEDAQLKLAQAMGNAGTYTRESFKAMKDYAAQLQQTTKYGDETSLATMANLQTYGMEIEQLKAATKATQDLASAKGMDLRAASDLIGKAFVGETGTLSRYGIVLADGISKTEKFSAVLKLIEERFGNTAQAELETYSGQWKQIANFWGDQMETAGLVVLKVIESVQFAFGLAATAIYTILEYSFRGLSTLLGAAEKIPIVGSKFTGMRKEVDFIAGNFEKAKESVLGFTDKNYEMAKSFDQVEKYAEKAFGNTAKHIKKMTEETEAAKKAAEELAKMQEKAYLKEMELLEARDKEEIEYFKNYNKRVVDQAAEAIKTGSENLAAENKMKIEGWNALAEKHKEINAAMTEQEKYELSQRLNSYNEIYSMISEISNAGAAGSYQGISMMSSNVKGLTDIGMKTDKYSLEIEAAHEHYLKIREMYRGHQDEMNMITEAAANRDIAIENAKKRQKTSIVSGTLGTISGLMYAFYEASDKQNEAAFLAYKAFAIAQAIVSTSMAATQALSAMPYPWNLIAMATVIAAGMAQVMNIATQQIGSGTSASASISGSVTSASTSTTESASAGTTSTTTETKSAVSLNVYVEGNIIDHTAFARELIPSLTKAIQDGAH